MNYHSIITITLVIIAFSLSCQSEVVFDGIDDYITVSDSASLNITGNQLSINAWIYWTGTNSTLIEKIDDFSGKSRGFLIRRSSVASTDWRTYVANDSDGWKYAQVTLPQNQWFHFVLVYNGSTIQHYINGQASGSTTIWSGNIGTTLGQDLNIGREIANGNKYTMDGAITELAIWDIGLTQKDVDQLYQSRVKRTPLQVQPDDLLAYWPLDDVPNNASGNGRRFNDYSGNGNVGIGNDGTNNVGMIGMAESVLSYPE